MPALIPFGVNGVLLLTDCTGGFVGAGLEEGFWVLLVVVVVVVVVVELVELDE
jgi:hypothetical protein